MNALVAGATIPTTHSQDCPVDFLEHSRNPWRRRVASFRRSWREGSRPRSGRLGQPPLGHSRTGSLYRRGRPPQHRAAIAAYYVIAPCEAFSNLARFDGVRYGYQEKGCPPSPSRPPRALAWLRLEAKRRRCLVPTSQLGGL